MSSKNKKLVNKSTKRKDIAALVPPGLSPPSPSTLPAAHNVNRPNQYPLPGPSGQQMQPPADVSEGSDDTIIYNPTDYVQQDMLTEIDTSISPLFELDEIADAFLEIPDLNLAGEDLFSVERISHMHSQLHNITASRFKINPMPDLLSSFSITTMQELEDAIEQIFQSILSGFTKLCKPDDIVKITVDQDQLDMPVIIPPRRLLDITIPDILARIIAVLQSKRTVVLDDTFFVGISVIRVVQGGVMKTGMLLNPHLDKLYAKKSVIRVKSSEDNTCLARAILISWASKNRIPRTMFMQMKMDNEELDDTALRVKRVCESLYYSWKNPNLDVQDRVVKRLLEIAGLDHVDSIRLDHIPAIEDVLHCGVNIISQTAGNAFVRKASDKAQELGWKNVFVYHHKLDPDDPTSDYHFDAITCLGAFFQVRSMCENCFKIKKDPNKYCCGGRKCGKCNRRGCPILSKEPVLPMSCRFCTTTFETFHCFAAHKHNKMCETFWSCPHCNKRFRTCRRPRETHHCGEYYCQSCERFFMERHECYIRAAKKPQRKKHEKDRVMIFFDIETRQTTVEQCEKGTFLPQTRCEQCNTDPVPCTNCSRCLNCKSTSCGSFKHEANLVVAQKVCDNCVRRPFSRVHKCATCGDRCSLSCRKVLNDGIGRSYEQEHNCGNDRCGVREQVFFGDDCLTRFINWLINDKHNGCTVFSHNGASFDNLLVLHELLQKKNVQPAQVIFTGSKLLYMELVNPIAMRFLDSYKYLSYPLSALPASFDLAMDSPGTIRGDLAKGHFPHLFNAKCNENYVGPMPDVDCYGYKHMKPKQAEAFMKWYQSRLQDDNHFNFKQELIDYCINDVTILRLACLKFRDLVEELTGVDPYYKCLTLASLAMRIYRTLFITEYIRVQLLYRNGAPYVTPDQKDGWFSAVERRGIIKVNVGDGRGYIDLACLPEGVTIKRKIFQHTDLARVPPGGYRKYLHGYSKIAIHWLEYYAEKHNVKVYHAANWTEVGVFLPHGRTVYVDGFVAGDGRQIGIKSVLKQANEGDTILEMQGCWTHACPQCFPFGRDVAKCSRTGRTYNQIYQESVDRVKHLRAMGFTVVEMWEHEFKHLLRTDPAAKAFVDELPPIIPPLDPREAFYGGHTEMFTLAYDRQDDELLEQYPDVEYVDFTSLYPAVQKHCVFPLRHPEVITSGIRPEQVGGFFGLVKAKVLPPHNMLHPILPFRCGGKLMFPLCRTCAEKASRHCDCSVEDRAILGSWTTSELHYAVTKGYVILEVYEVYHYPRTTANTVDHFTNELVDLFGGYVNMFLKIKTESSGWPPGVETEPQKLQYIRDYREGEGITLEYDNIKPCPAKRNMAKVLLCSLYGKLSQSPGKPQTRIINKENPDELVKVISNPVVDVTDFNLLDEETLILEFSQKKESLHSGPTDNVNVAAFVTSNGRICLHPLLEQSDSRAMYCDTDSIVQRVDNAEQRFPLGKFLGQLTSEIPQGSKIQTFLATGPKSYAYVLSTGEAVLKYKGFTLSISASDHMNINSMRQMINEFSHKLRRDITGEDSPSNVIGSEIQVVVSHPRIFRVKRTMTLNTRSQTKRYTLCADKRIFFPNLTSLPFGFKY